MCCKVFLWRFDVLYGGLEKNTDQEQKKKRWENNFLLDREAEFATQSEMNPMKIQAYSLLNLGL